MASNVLSRDVMPVPPVVMIDLDAVIGELALDRRSRTRSGSSLTIGAAGDLVAGRGQQIGDRPAAGVGVFGARVADREDEAADRAGRVRLVLDVGS